MKNMNINLLYNYMTNHDYMINYKNKYLKYKNKYLNLKRLIHKKDAICMLCMLKDHYVLGACISAFTHKQFIKKYNLNIDLVMMCDDYIFNKYNHILNKYFDKVNKIQLEYFKYKDFNNKRHNSWMNYATNKWQCLKYDEYNKILFIDIDTLPTNKLFYNIFKFNTPAFHIMNLNEECINNNEFKYNMNFTYNEYLKDVPRFFNVGSIDGGICLLSPDKDLYNEYKQYTNEIFKDGIPHQVKVFPDESSIYNFFLKKKKIYKICNDYLIVAWSNNTKDQSDAKALNYLSTVKPWVKPFFLFYPEEFIWKDIYDLMNDSKLEELRKKIVINDIKKINFNDNNMMKNYNITQNNKNEMKYITKKLDFNFIKNLENKVKISNYGLIKKNKILELIDITE